MKGYDIFHLIYYFFPITYTFYRINLYSLEG